MGTLSGDRLQTGWSFRVPSAHGGSDPGSSAQQPGRLLRGVHLRAKRPAGKLRRDALHRHHQDLHRWRTEEKWEVKDLHYLHFLLSSFYSIMTWWNVLRKSWDYEKNEYVIVNREQSCDDCKIIILVKRRKAFVLFGFKEKTTNSRANAALSPLTHLKESLSKTVH